MRLRRVKTCRICKATKPLRQFYRHPTYSDGRMSDCKECKKAYSREMHWLKRDAILARKRIWAASAEQRAKRAAYQRSERGKQVKRETYRFSRYGNTPRVSRGTDRPWQSHTERKVCRPEALSVASSTRTREITGVAGSAETRYHERRADLHGVTGNAGAVGRGPHFGARS